MKQNILYVGLDVDDTQYHGAAFNKETGEVIDFKSRPTLKGLLQQLDRMKRHFQGHKIKLCYVAADCITKLKPVGKVIGPKSTISGWCEPLMVCPAASS